MRNIVIIALLTLMVSDLQAQRFWQKISGGFNGTVGVPSGEFKEANNNVAFGLRGHILYNPSRQVPLHFGMELGYATMGTQRRFFVDQFWDEYELSASSNIFSIHFKFRLQQQNTNSVKPFLEGIGGWNSFFSSVNITRLTFWGPSWNQNWGESTKASWALTYGGAAGANIRLNREGNLWLELKTAYMIGRRAEYYINPRIGGGGQVTFDYAESETNMVIPQVGVRFGL